MSNYRKIWETAYGEIPYDSAGRRMEIHHIDGDRTNNNLDNLQLLTIAEHYDIHFQKSDWAACQSISNRMSITPAEKSKRCSELANKRVTEGSHHFLDPEFQKKNGQRISKDRAGINHPLYGTKASKETIHKRSNSHKKLVDQGIHHLQSEEHRERMRNKSLEELKNGTHIFMTSEFRKKHKDNLEKQLNNKTHPFNRQNRTDPNKILMHCIVCQKTIPKPAFNRFHKYHNTIKEN
jgi:hypothetical protein